MKRRLNERIEIGDEVYSPRDEYYVTVLDIEGDQVLADGPMGKEYHNLSDLEKKEDYESEDLYEGRKKVIRLTESDLIQIVKQIIKESPDPKLDFILTDDEKTCLNPRYKNLSNAKKRRWYVDEVKQKLILGELDSSSMLVPYCSYDINDRPLHPSKEQGRYVYDVNTGVITFG
jgi:hypothetical protein